MKRYTLLLIIYICCCSLLWSITPRVQHYTVAQGLLNNQVCQLIELPNGQILVGTEGAFNLFDGRQFTSLPCRLDSLYQLPSFGMHSYLWQGDSLLWLKDFHWLYLYDTRHQRFRYDYLQWIEEPAIQDFMAQKFTPQIIKQREAISLRRNRIDSIFDMTDSGQLQITSYLCDRQKGEWFGIGGKGIIYISPHLPRVQALHVDVKGKLKRIAEVDAHHFLLGTTEGIYLINKEQMRTEKVIAEGGVHCMDMKTDNKGRIYISTTLGLYVYDHGNVMRYHQGNVKGFVHQPIRLALPLSDGRILVCNLLHHLGYLYPNEHRFHLLNDSLPQINAYRALIEAIALPESNKVLITTQNGAFMLDTSCDKLCEIDSTKLYYAYSQKFNSSLIDIAGKCWLGTHNGLLCEGQRFTNANGLSNSSIRSIAEAPDGSIWIGTSDGINRIKDNNILSLGTSDGIPEEEMEERGALIMSDGTAFFVTSNALLTFSTNDFNTPQKVMPVVLTGFQVMNERIDSPDSIALSLPHNRNYLRMEFSALNYAAPEHVRYRYRMQNFDNHWLQTSNENGAAIAIYNAMPPGQYQLQLQCAIANGTWGPILTKEITICPPWWQTWWFRLSYSLSLVIIIIWGAYIYWKRQKARMARKSEEMVNRMFEVRDKARRHFAQQLNISPARMAINSQEENFISRLMEVIEQNLSNTEYSVEQMARDVAMERTGLYRKLQAIAGITPSEFLRSVRLKRAAQIFENNKDISITEVSELVGFASSRHFATCFKQMFGCTPSDYRKG